MKNEKVFAAGTVIRCNRCDAKSPATREFRAVRENEKVWRVQDMMVAGCGHMDAHWVFDCDLKEA